MIYAVEEDTNKDKAIRRDADTLIHSLLSLINRVGQQQNNSFFTFSVFRGKDTGAILENWRPQPQSTLIIFKLHHQPSTIGHQIIILAIKGRGRLT